MGQLQRYVFVEFDYAVLHGISDLVAAANGVLAPLKAPVDSIAFTRFISGKTKSAGVSAVLHHAGVTHEASPLASEIATAFRSALAAKAGSASASCKAFVEPLLAKGVNVVFVTQADEAAVKSALEGILGDSVVVIQEPSQHVGGYGWESWRRMCKRIGAHERLCAAVVGTGFSAKGAIAAGLYAVASCDPLAVNQDFSGVDLFTEKFDAALIPELLRVLWKND